MVNIHLQQQLGEILKKQQDPFDLEIFLLERGCLKKLSDLECNLTCFSSSTSKKPPRQRGRNKRRKAIPNCSKIVKVVFSKLVSINESKPIVENSEERCVGGQEAAESDGFTSPGSMTLFNSCTSSDTDDPAKDEMQSSLENCREKAAADAKLLWRFMEESKQLSPVSVLEDLASDETSPTHKKQKGVSKLGFRFSKKVTDDSILSVSLEKVHKYVGSDPSSQCPKKPTGVLQRTSQFLYDCVREIVETSEKKEAKKRNCQEFLGSNEIGKLKCKRVRAWGRYGDETSITQLLNLEISASTQEWREYKPQVMEIGIAIGDDILEEILDQIINDYRYLLPF